MQTAAHQAYTAAWRVTREGGLVAGIDIREEGGSVVVATTVDGKTKPHQFATLEAADRFLRDLTASFAYLGCELNPA
jgi:hypothetical protein